MLSTPPLYLLPLLGPSNLTSPEVLSDLIRDAITTPMAATAPITMPLTNALLSIVLMLSYL
jgi:hypothetical protein